MKNLKKAVVRRAICVFLTATMLCADTGVTVYAAEGAEQKVSEGTVEETSTGEVQAEDGQTEEASLGNDWTEGDLAEEGEAGKPSPEETLVKGETADENSGGENAETSVTEENPVMGEATVEEPVVKEEDNTGEAPIEKSVSENDIEESVSVNAIEEEVAENLEKAEGDSEEDSGEIIASGSYEDITWGMDADGKLKVECTREFSNCNTIERALWYKNRFSIKSS